jgi:hypothetical protein
MTPLDRDFLKNCALESTKDDYESMSTLAAEVEKWATKEGRPFAAEVLLEVLLALVREGRIGVYRFSQSEGRYVEAQFERDRLEGLWFLAKR